MHLQSNEFLTLSKSVTVINKQISDRNAIVNMTLLSYILTHWQQEANQTVINKKLHYMDKQRIMNKKSIDYLFITGIYMIFNSYSISKILRKVIDVAYKSQRCKGIQLIHYVRL